MEKVFKMYYFHYSLSDVHKQLQPLGAFVTLIQKQNI